MAEAQKKNSGILQLNFIQGSGTFGGGSSSVVYRVIGDRLSIGDSIEGIEITTDLSTFEENHYLKHEIDSNNLITASYVCFVTNSEYCLQGGNPSYFENNVAILRANETWFNNQGGSCSFGDYSRCINSPSIGLVEANKYGDIEVSANGFICYVSSSGEAHTNITSDNDGNLD